MAMSRLTYVSAATEPAPMSLLSIGDKVPVLQRPEATLTSVSTKCDGS